jgi:hypothetical protein
MSMGVVNPYSGQDLFIAEEYHARLGDFVSRDTKDALPFSRQVDAWWIAIGVGNRIGVRTPLPEQRVKFNDGSILNSDPWRITQLELLALSEGDQEILNEPARVIRLATEYANTGFGWIMETLVGEPEATLTLMNQLQSQLD